MKDDPPCFYAVNKDDVNTFEWPRYVASKHDIMLSLIRLLGLVAVPLLVAPVCSLLVKKLSNRGLLP
jgi:hypothetical protein